MYSGLDANAAVREALRSQDFSNGTDTASLRLLAALDPAARFTARSSSVEDPTPYHPCNETLFLNMVDAVDLNGDGRRDLVVHYWCNQWNQPPTFDGPTPNSLLVLLAQADGSYRIANEAVFGTQRVDLGGASRKSRVADFNGDGLPDILYAANREDGRPLNADASNQFAPLPVLLSQGGGRYQVEAIGPPSWYHGIDLAANEAGRFDAVAIGFGNLGTRGYRWTATGWTRLDGYPMLSGLTFSFVNEPGVQTSQVVTGGLRSAAQLQVFSKVAGAWQETSNVLFPSRKVPYLTWQGTQTEVDTISLGSDDLVAAGFDETCVMHLKPGGPPVIYLNDGNEHLVRLSTQAFPQAPGCYGGTGSRLADLNGDGIEDLILFRTSPAAVACETAPITVFYGLRRLALGG